MSEERATNGVDKMLGQRVRARRLAIGMSQEQLAEALGITFQQVQKYEKGVNRIAASRLFAIAEVLDYPIAEFFHGLSARGRPSDERRNEHLLATREGAELASLFSGLKNQRVRAKALAMLRVLVDSA